ncbi:MAG: hypothetical protein ACI870_000118 [Crocinitomicaceae bacterium]|jgi:hypothetical protein
MKYKLVITHNGKFHTDELSSDALGRVLKVIQFDAPIERRKRGNITDEEFYDPTILILDIGERYQPELGNFDHHQDPDLEATNMLVLRYWCEDKQIFVEHMSRKLFKYISDLDRGLRDRRTETAGFTAVIRNYNGYGEAGFEKARELIMLMLKGYIHTAHNTIKTQKKWPNFERVSSGKIAIMKPGDRFVIDWQDLAEEDGVYLLLLPNKDDKTMYNIMVRDTRILTISKHLDQKYLHYKGFLGTYKSYEAAVKHAKQMVRSLPVK